MRKIIVVLAMSVIAAVGLRAQEKKMLKVNVQAANVRIEPDMNSALVKQVKLGTLLESRLKIGDWYEVVVTDDEGTAISGYISSNVVDVVGPGVTKPAVPTVQPPPAEVRRRWPLTMIFGRYGRFEPSDKTFKTVYGPGPIYGGEIRMRLIGGFYLSLEGGYFNKQGRLTLTQDETTMTIFPIDAMIVFHALPGFVLPYIGAGGTACNYREKNVIGTVDDWGFGFVVCAGITTCWKVIGIDAQIKYHSVIVKPQEDKVDLGGLTFSVGLGFVF